MRRRMMAEARRTSCAHWRVAASTMSVDAFEAHRGLAFEGRADGGAPRERHLAGRQRRVAQQLGERAGNRGAERPHRIDLIIQLTCVWCSRPPLRAAPSCSARRASRSTSCPSTSTSACAPAKRPATTSGAWRPRSRRRRGTLVRLKPDATEPDATIIVLGADTAVVVDDEILGKPRDDQEAAAMLRRLSGRRHEVLTGVSLRSSAGERGLVEATGVYMMELRDEDIAWYVASGEGRDKAGAYGDSGPRVAVHPANRRVLRQRGRAAGRGRLVTLERACIGGVVGLF